MSLVVVGVVVLGVGIDEGVVVEVVVTTSTAVDEIAVVDIVEDELDEGVVIVVIAEAMVLGVGVAEEGSLQSPSATQVGDPILSTGAAEGQAEIEGEEFRG